MLCGSKGSTTGEMIAGLVILTSYKPVTLSSSLSHNQSTSILEWYAGQRLAPQSWSRSRCFELLDSCRSGLWFLVSRDRGWDLMAVTRCLAVGKLVTIPLPPPYHSFSMGALWSGYRHSGKCLQRQQRYWWITESNSTYSSWECHIHKAQVLLVLSWEQWQTKGTGNNSSDLLQQ